MSFAKTRAGDTPGRDRVAMPPRLVRLLGHSAWRWMRVGGGSRGHSGHPSVFSPRVRKSHAVGQSVKRTLGGKVQAWAASDSPPGSTLTIFSGTDSPCPLLFMFFLKALIPLASRGAMLGFLAPESIGSLVKELESWKRSSQAKLCCIICHEGQCGEEMASLCSTHSHTHTHRLLGATVPERTNIYIKVLL